MHGSSAIRNWTIQRKTARYEARKGFNGNSANRVAHTKQSYANPRGPSKTAREGLLCYCCADPGRECASPRPVLLSLAREKKKRKCRFCDGDPADTAYDDTRAYAGTDSPRIPETVLCTQHAVGARDRGFFLQRSRASVHFLSQNEPEDGVGSSVRSLRNPVEQSKYLTCDGIDRRRGVFRWMTCEVSAHPRAGKWRTEATKKRRTAFGGILFTHPDTHCDSDEAIVVVSPRPTLGCQDRSRHGAARLGAI